MNVKEIVAAFDAGMAALGYAKDTTREGAAPGPNVKAYRLIFEGFTSSVSTRSAPQPNSYDADISVVLSHAAFGGHAEDATIQLAEQAEAISNKLIEWMEANYENKLQVELVEARGYIGEGRMMKCAIRFQAFYDYSAN